LSGIRVTYAGLISFVSGLVISVFGLVTILIITRNLTPEEFGTWTLIISLLVYVNYILPMITYWVTRETARGIESGKTAILSSGLFSCIGISLYLVIVYLVSGQSDADQDILLSAFILVPMIFLHNVLVAINYGWKPHAVSYGLLALEASKIPLLLITVYWLQMGVLGIIFAMTIAYVPSILVLFIFGKEKIKNKIKIIYIKKWLKLFWLPSYPSVGSVIAAFDVLIFTIITGSVIGLAFYAAALVVSKICTSAISISSAVYPKLLEGKQMGNILQENITLLSFFVIPLATLSIFFAKPAVYALNPIYVEAYPAVIFMTIRMFLFTYSVSFAEFLKGGEKVDTQENASFKDYIRSKLFLVPSIRFIQYSAFVISLAFVLIMVFSSSTDVELITYWAIVWLAVEIPVFIYLYILVKKNFKFKMEVKNFVKYLLASILTIGISYYMSLEFLEFNPSIIIFLPNLLLFVGLGIFGYLALTYFIDEKTRKIFSAIIHELKNRST